MLGIFDSGIGGLSVWRSIRSRLTNIPIMYLADQAFVPYGSRTSEELLSRGTQILSYFENNQIRQVVIACNTATVSMDINKLRQLFPKMSLVGVEPPIKKLASLSKTGHVGLFATPNTCNANRTQLLCQKFIPDGKIQIIPVDDWAVLVEAGMPEPVTTKALKHYIKELADTVDVVGLGCTHYSFLLEKIQTIDPKRSYIDVADAVARQTQVVLESIPYSSSSASDVFVTTSGDPSALKKSLVDLLNISTQVESIVL